MKFVCEYSLIFGFIRFVRAKWDATTTTVTLFLYLQLFFTVVIPILIGVLCGLAVGYKAGPRYGITISMAALFVVCVSLAFMTWYAAKWTFDRLTQLLLAIGCLACLVLAAVTSLNSGYSGMSAILMVINFGPACRLVYLKRQSNDINVKLLFHNIAKKLDSGIFSLNILDENEPEKSKKHA